MPMFSLVVAAYNRGTAMGQCLDSLVNQTCHDIEIIVVDDASTDDTLTTIKEYAAKDHRIHVIAKSVNEGAHLARKDGVAASTGDHVIFVDGDDELELTACEVLGNFARKRQDTDIIRFGRTVIGETEADRKAAYATEQLFNVQCETLHGGDIAASIFSDMFVHRNMWCVIDCVFRGDFVRGAFAGMRRDALGRTQDAFETFVISHKAETYVPFPEFRGLRYHEGRGVSGLGVMEVGHFIRHQAQLHMVAEAITSHAATLDDDAMTQARWYTHHAGLIIGREWADRVAEQDKLQAAQAIAQICGNACAASILIDPTLGRAQEVWLKDDGYPAPDNSYFVWYHSYRSIRPAAFDDAELAEKDAKLQRLHEVIDARELQRIAEVEKASEAQREHEEQKRLLKSGSFVRRIVDTVLPEQSKLRAAIRGFIAPFRA